MDKIEVYEEKNSKYADKYTVVIKRGVDSFDVYGMSSHPSSPQGVNVFDGTYKKKDIDRMVKNLGSIKVKVVPVEIKKAIKERLK